MTISIDTNILSTLLIPSDPDRFAMAETLDSLRGQDQLLVTGFVYAELMAGQRYPHELDGFFREMLIVVDWTTDEAVWRAAGEAFRTYSERRRVRQKEEARRLMTDFLIGAHAQVHGYAVLTRDKRIFRAAFPNVTLLRS